MFENMKSETLVERGSIEILNMNQPLNNINNVWQLPFPSGKAATSKSLESQNVQSQAVRRIIQTPSPESFPGASQDPLQAVTAFPTLQRKSTPENSPNTSVPRTDQNIYPHATIKPEFRERYPQLVDVFKWAVETEKVLRKHTSKINYELLLCGSTPANAVASVIIFCAEALFSRLRSLLASEHICLQYQRKNPSFRDKFKLAPSKTHPQVSAPIVVPFNVVYWRVVNSPTLRNSAMEQVVARNHSSLTMCGSLIKYGDRTSTLGLLISMDSKLYGLTVDHLFKDQQGEEQPMTANEAEVLYDEDDYDDSEPEWSWIDDVNYEDFENAECVSDAESVSSGGSHAKITMDREPNEDFGESINGHKADSIFKTDATTAYLDWALIEFDDGYYERPNAFFSEDDPTNPKFFGILAAAPKTSDVKVFMISGVSGTRKGVMLNRSSYIGGEPGVIDGDCGSLIVDQETLEVYGHVVASNPLGEAYVVPLQNTFHQISSAFGAKDLCLPNPVQLMESIVAHYSQKGDTGVADQTKQILASMKDPVSKLSPGSLAGLNLRLFSEFAATVQAQIEIELSDPSSRAYNKSPLSPQSATGSYLDERRLSDSGLLVKNQQGSQDYQRHQFPPINPQEQNSPCNTLSVGNLPSGTSAKELMAMFSKQKGFKRLCLTTKQNGPTCSVEFEDVIHATNSLRVLNGTSLPNSTKGGIQLSFSKQPLGVRSGPSRPPPSLPTATELSASTAPSEYPSEYNTSRLVSRGGKDFSTGWNGPAFPTMGTGATNDFPPAFMYGK
ncbi:hypothetical protein BOTNAR_0044g00130 [Botryotinia narcissicola]|uniref:RRM domain-containing protein n=1 Tax=Botryotinia narcissicola TaxID=278944 RepID=A0A4Z1J6Z5_9HELO|nr:hypothetical protein BOTNAR_0044g00130 [Botryotinia narcissicola]